jgi:hypothetical protein
MVTLGMLRRAMEVGLVEIRVISRSRQSGEGREGSTCGDSVQPQRAKFSAQRVWLSCGPWRRHRPKGSSPGLEPECIS